MKIRACTNEDASTISDIYNHYVNNTIVSFEESPVSQSAMQARIAKVTKNYPWLVAELNNQIIGYAYADLWQERIAYRYSLITTIYFHPEQTGRGYGTELYKALFAALADGDCRILIAGISMPNAASVALHERLGFKKVAHFEEVGHKMNRWIDVGYWQRKL